jgi:hypothetical protein
MQRKRLFRPWMVLAAVTGLVSAACGDDGGTTTSPTSPATTASPTVTATETASPTETEPTSVYEVDLTGICPDTIVLQTDWFPEVEHGGAYNLIGAGGEIDAGAGTYTGPLRDTGVQLEIRAGGPFIGFSSPTAQMYSQEDIFVAYADTGDQIRSFGTLPAIGIVAPLEIGPQILMFDPAQYDFQTVTDVKDSGATVLYFEGGAFMDYLIGTGQLSQDQVDASYDGSPARWVAEQGAVVQQGFATNEPYKYENDIPEWMKPVDYLLLHDAGWRIYQSNIVVRPETVTESSDCLAALVPMWQQAQIDYINDPAEANQVILDIVVAMNTFWTLSPELNDYADQTMRDLGVVSNGEDSTLGNYDMDRVQTFMDEFIPIALDKGAEIPEGLTPEDIVTNEFVNPDLGL